ncbi:MAG TPA: alpha/beta hydrolase [Pyrinomonadaceae bacterium]|nr:alpha/beta hydrolase [Pyrinomonadaceae bacterium]
MKTRITLLIVVTFCLATLANAQTPKETTVFGQKIHYVEAGSGPNVILLHGLGGSTQAWQFNIGPLAEKFHVYVPDQIGFGKSDKPLVMYRIRTYVDFLDQFCKQLKIERATLVGNSMGGWIAAAFTAAFPDRVDKLVLVDAAGYAPPKELDMRTLFALNPTTREGMKVLTARVFYNKAFQTDAVIDMAIAARLAAGDGFTIKSITESIIRGEDFLDDTVKTIKRPTLIVWGREDGLVPLAEGERFHKDIAGSKLVVFDQCGHVPNFEKPGEFNAAVIKFLTTDAQ